MRGEPEDGKMLWRELSAGEREIKRWEQGQVVGGGFAQRGEQRDSCWHSVSLSAALPQSVKCGTRRNAGLRSPGC